MSLKEYSGKRDFEKTAEPPGQLAPTRQRRRFVIQKHAASRLHYDFRLELNGTLKSWAVPKGIPFTKGQRRLAVEVEDHPVSYINFEGTIPQGQYGGGTVMVWDRGTFEPLSDAPLKELAGGKLHFVLKGKKLQGEWYLIRLRDGKQWLLIRGKDDMPPVSKKMDDTSVLSGRSMANLSNRNGVGRSRVSTKPARPASHGNSVKSSAVSFIEPMKAKFVKSPPRGQWLYEIKFDGFRALALKSGDGVRLLSRNEKDFGGKFPEVLEGIAQLEVQDVMLDGEIVALDTNGRFSFQLLQASDLGQERPPIFFYAFDLLQLNGKDLRDRPVTTRKAALAKLLKKPPGVLRFSPALSGEVSVLLKHAQRLGVEGLIGKRKDSVYEAGRRSGAWIKLKLLREQEMVIGGYSNPSGTRNHFGALLVGYYERKQLKFAGKVGSGFDEVLLKRLHGQFQKLLIPKCPFENLPEKKKGRYGQGVTPAEMKRCHWLKPELVGQIKFSEWTRDAKLRHPVFLGLREDKKAADVAREEAD